MQDFLSLNQAVLTALNKGQPPIAQSGLPQHLQEITLEECQRLVVGYLQKLTSDVLSLMPIRYPEPRQSLSDLGFDSMKAMELRHRIATDLEVEIPPQEFSGGSTLAQLAALVLNQLILTNVIQSEPLSPGQNDDWEEITL